MAYTNKINDDKYKQIFPTRLRALMKNNCTQKELGDKINVTYQAIGAYMRGESMPVLCVAQSIADYFNVSLDYLSGRSGVPSRNEQIQRIHQKTMLSEDAIQNLCSLSPSERKLIDDLLSSPADLHFLALAYAELKTHIKIAQSIDHTNIREDWAINTQNDLDYIRFTLSNRFARFAENDSQNTKEDTDAEN